VKQQTKTLLVWLVLIVAVLGLANMFNSSDRLTERTYHEFSEDVKSGKFSETPLTIEVHPAHVVIRYTLEAHDFAVTGPVIDELYETLDKHSVNYKVEPEDGSGFMQILLMWLPAVLLLVIMFVFMRQMQAGGGKAMSFGKSKAKLLNEHQTKITFKDVAGIEEAREEVEEIIDFLRDTRKYLRVGGRIPKGVLLMGPPGTGKTLLARAIAGEAGVAFFSISGSDFVEMFVGVGASRVRDLFEQGKKNAPCIIFIDEIDAVGRHRGAGLGGGHDEREQTLNQLLVEMDGFEANDGVILIAATNRPDVLDPALLRPGRFDRRIMVGLPHVLGREEILAVHTRKIPMADDVDLEKIARGTPQFSGAELENLVNEAALLAARHDRDHVVNADFENARDKVMMGAERKSLKISEREKRLTAWHEAGHTLVACLLPKDLVDPIHKVTIIPRGPTLGVTHFLPEQDRHSLDQRTALGMIAVALGGRIAEELALDGRKDAGASNDIQQATSMARRMVCEWGMSDKLGLVSFASKEREPFLGRDLGRQQAYSEATAMQIDAEIHDIIQGQYERAQSLVKGNYPALERLAMALMQHETLDAEAVAALIANRPHTFPAKVAAPKPLSTASSRGDASGDSDEASAASGGFPVAEPS